MTPSLSRIRATRRLLPGLLGLLLSLTVTAGCSTLPTSGEVHTQPDSAGGTEQAPYFAPQPPSAGANREDIVRGFLLATQANPPTTSVARSFLSERARNTWNPDQGSLVYERYTLETNLTGVSAALTDAHRLDYRGAWQGGTANTSATLDFKLVLEKGEWRIDNPPSVLPITTSYFSSVYAPFSLFYFDRTRSVLVPTRVYLPEGEQVASSLVRGLLAGPSSALAPAAGSAFPPGTELADLAVVVNDHGLATIPLSAQIQQLSPADLTRAVVQLAATLRQVPGVIRLRITVDGAAIPLFSSQTDYRVDTPTQYDPVAASGREVIAIADGRVVAGAESTLKPIGGPLGQPGFALRSVARRAASGAVAAVAINGHRLFLAPDTGAATPVRVRSLLDGSTDLLRPAFDRFGGLWVVDDTPSGAVVHLLTGTRDRVVPVPGVTGRQLSSFTVTRDGASFVAGLADGTAPTVVVSTIVREERGRVAQVLPARRIDLADLDLGPVLDLSQDSASTVAVLAATPAGESQVVSVELDGSPGSQRTVTPDPLPGRLAAVLASPDPGLLLRVVTTDGRMLELTTSGAWTRIANGVLAAAYPQ